MKLFQIAKSIGGSALMALGTIGSAVAGPGANIEATYQGGSFCAIEGGDFTTALVPSRTDQAVLGGRVDTNIDIRQNADTEWSFSDLSTTTGGVDTDTSSMTVDVFNNSLSTGESVTVGGVKASANLDLTQAIMNAEANTVFESNTTYNMNATLTCVADSVSGSPQLCLGEDGEELSSCSTDVSDTDS